LYFSHKEIHLKSACDYRPLERTLHMQHRNHCMPKSLYHKSRAIGHTIQHSSTSGSASDGHHLNVPHCIVYDAIGYVRNMHPAVFTSICKPLAIIMDSGVSECGQIQYLITDCLHSEFAYCKIRNMVNLSNLIIKSVSSISLQLASMANTALSFISTCFPERVAFFF
jgi:hypothetical protein